MDRFTFVVVGLTLLSAFLLAFVSGFVIGRMW